MIIRQPSHNIKPVRKTPSVSVVDDAVVTSSQCKQSGGCFDSDGSFQNAERKYFKQSPMIDYLRLVQSD